MEQLRRVLADRRVLAGLFAGFFTITAISILVFQEGISVGDFRGFWELSVGKLRERPLWLFMGLVFLPGLPVPTSALLFLAGVVWRENPVLACLIHFVAMLLNLSWTYWLSEGFGRKTVDRMLGILGIRIPELIGENHLKVMLILKLTPGIPLFVQNYLCGFLGVPFRLYLLVSLICNGIIGTGFVLAGVGFGEGKLIPAVTGISVVVLGFLITRWTRGWLAERKG